LRNGSSVAEDEVRTAQTPGQIVLNAHKPQIKNDGIDAVAVNVHVVDEAGNPHPTANSLIVFEVIGGNVLGVGNGNPLSHEADFASQRNLFNGKCQAVISCTEGTDKLIVKAHSTGLKSAELELNVQQIPAEFRLARSDNRQVDEWKISTFPMTEKPDPNVVIDWGENNAYVAINMTGERFQTNLHPGWTLYRTNIKTSGTKGVNAKARFFAGLTIYRKCEVWVNGKLLMTDENPESKWRAVNIEFFTEGKEQQEITLLLFTAGGKAGINGRDAKIEFEIIENGTRNPTLP
jgi:beta-galactosidase